MAHNWAHLRCAFTRMPRHCTFKAFLTLSIVSSSALVLYSWLLVKEPAYLSMVRLQSRIFAKNYFHDYEESADQFFNRLKGIISHRWKADRNKTRKFREDLRIALREAGQIENFLLTNKTPPGTRIPCYMKGWSHVSTTLWKHLPRESVFKPGQFKRCSIVGSSGILLGSRCMNTIDKAQFVVRFNIAPVREFETDVGTKTNFTTLNPSLLLKKLNKLKAKADRSQLLNSIRQFSGSYLWLPIFAVSSNVAILTQATEIANKSGIVHPIHGHPKHFLSVSTLWGTIRKKWTWPSTGLYTILTFVDVCDQIDVFGFWPLPTFINGSSSPYHFHDTVMADKSVHDFVAEFKFLVHLHELGVIQMHFTSCQ